MSTDISKRSLTAGLTVGLGAGALALLAQTERASADTPFSNFAFPAAGAPTPRTMPDRLAEIKNVRDFGAVGDAVTDDAPAIQRTVNWTTNAHRGTIYFPPGTYRVNTPITFNTTGALSIIFRGDGLRSQLIGNFAGYVIDRSQGDGMPGIGVVERLDIKNTHLAGGGVRILGSVGAEVRNCRVQAHVCIALGGSQPSDTCKDSSVNNCLLNGLGTEETGSIGVLMGPDTAVYNCGIVNFEHGIRAYGTGISIAGCRIEVNKVGIFLGRDIAGNTQPVSGGHITGSSTEANDTAIYCWAAMGVHVSGIVVSGTTNAPSGSSIYGFRLYSVSDILFTSCLLSHDSAFGVAGIYIEGQPTRLTFMSTRASSWALGAGVDLSSRPVSYIQTNCPFA